MNKTSLIYFLLAALCLALMLVSCNEMRDDYGKSPRTGLQVLKIDSCEYVLYLGYQSAATMVHHGNCHNSAHKK